MTNLNADALQQLVIEAMDDLKARDIRDINVEGVAGFTDRMVFASGTSNRHVKSIAQSVVEKVKQAGLAPLGLEGEDVGDWVLIDLGDVVAHIMLPDTRQFYDIERLWSEQAGQDADAAAS
jgi:ribosome-associated protein